MKISRLDEKLHDLSLPALKEENEIDFKCGDIVVVCAGFEDRAKKVLEQIIERKIEGIFVFIVLYEPIIIENTLNELLSLCEKANIEASKITYNRKHPDGVGIDIVNKISSHDGNLWIDISGMSRLLIIQIIDKLKERKTNFSSIKILYSEAEEYPPKESDVSNSLKERKDGYSDLPMFLSSGVLDVSILPELSSITLQGQPIRMVVFPTFSCGQLIALRTIIQPSYTTVINGKPPSKENHWRLEAIRTLNEIDKIVHKKDEYTVSTLDYRETYKLITKIYSKYGALEKLVVAPIGSKMQTVGLALVRAHLNDIQIVYPTPQSFINPGEYTKGVKTTYSLDISDFPCRSDL